jgi:hypothetical protein
LEISSRRMAVSMTRIRGDNGWYRQSKGCCQSILTVAQTAALTVVRTAALTAVLTVAQTTVPTPVLVAVR